MTWRKKHSGGLWPWFKKETFRSKIGPGMWECSNTWYLTWFRRSITLTYGWSPHEKTDGG